MHNYINGIFDLFGFPLFVSEEFLRYIHVYYLVSQYPFSFYPTEVKTIIHREFGIMALFVQLRSQVLFIEEFIKNN